MTILTVSKFSANSVLQRKMFSGPKEQDSASTEILCIDKDKLIVNFGIIAFDLRNWFGGLLREIMIPLNRSQKIMDHSSKVKQKPLLGKLNNISYLLNGGETYK